jgi:hypothetical protein
MIKINFELIFGNQNNDYAIKKTHAVCVGFVISS